MAICMYDVEWHKNNKYNHTPKNAKYHTRRLLRNQKYNLLKENQKCIETWNNLVNNLGLNPEAVKIMDETINKAGKELRKKIDSSSSAHVDGRNIFHINSFDYKFSPIIAVEDPEYPPLIKVIDFFMDNFQIGKKFIMDDPSLPYSIAMVHDRDSVIGDSTDINTVDRMFVGYPALIKLPASINVDKYTNILFTRIKTCNESFYYTYQVGPVFSESSSPIYSMFHPTLYEYDESLIKNKKVFKKVYHFISEDDDFGIVLNIDSHQLSNMMNTLYAIYKAMSNNNDTIAAFTEYQNIDINNDKKYFRWINKPISPI